jgi:hypothetical protein
MTYHESQSGGHGHDDPSGHEDVHGHDRGHQPPGTVRDSWARCATSCDRTRTTATRSRGAHPAPGRRQQIAGAPDDVLRLATTPQTGSHPRHGAPKWRRLSRT